MPSKPPKFPLTHFLCIPIASETSRRLLEASIKYFNEELLSVRSDVFADAAGAGRALRPVSCLHLTLGVMSLREQERVDRALQLFKEINLGRQLSSAARRDNSEADQTLSSWQQMSRSEIGDEYPALKLEATEGTRINTSIGGASGVYAPTGSAASLHSEPRIQTNPLTINLSSLAAMHSNSRTTMLYAIPSDQTDRLYPFCESIRDTFIRNGLMISENRPLKLHATVLNTIYASESSQSQRSSESSEKTRDVINSQHQHSGLEAVECRNGQTGKKGGSKKRKNRAPLKIDATALIESFREFKWAENLRLERLAICKMGTERVVDEQGRVIDEYYEELAMRSLLEL